MIVGCNEERITLVIPEEMARTFPIGTASCQRMADGSRDAEPTVTTVDDRTIRISVKHVAMIVCRSRQWQSLIVEYDIGRVVDEPDDGKPPGECPRD